MFSSSSVYMLHTNEHVLNLFILLITFLQMCLQGIKIILAFFFFLDSIFIYWFLPLHMNLVWITSIMAQLAFAKLKVSIRLRGMKQGHPKMRPLLVRVALLTGTMAGTSVLLGQLYWRLQYLAASAEHGKEWVMGPFPTQSCRKSWPLSLLLQL